MPFYTLRSMIRVLVEAPRWLLLAALVFAPWAYGSTRPWGIRLLSIGLVLITSLWLLECLFRRKRPQVSWLPLSASLGLIAQGWWMAINAKSIFDPQLMILFPTKPLTDALPGSADGLLSSVAMLLITGLLGVFLFTIDLASRPQWRRRLWLTMALTGISIAIFGIVQKVGGTPVLAWVWEDAKQDINNNFAMYRYRGNAGAFLNICLPLAGALAFLAFRRSGNQWGRALWLAGFLIVATGVQLNPSRLSWCIAMLLLAGFGAHLIYHLWKEMEGSFSFRQLAGYGVILLFVLGTLASISLFGGWETSWGRMKQLGVDPSDRSPTEIYVHMVPKAGLLGFGPGTFQVVFPNYQHSYNFGDRQVPEFWTAHFWPHAHEDYLEYAIEWGWLGAAMWAALIFGGIILGIRRFLVSREFESRWLLFCSLLGIAGTLLHAFLDFPLQIASIQLYFFVLLGICCSGKRIEDSEAQRKATRPETVEG
ncbi:MAG: O-antigen polymerase [Verrucomicrobiales bacterium]|nr:O-antigen polymerase [Verrucomicrobiales bacterium]